MKLRLLLACLAAFLLPASAWSATRDVLAHSSSDQMWVAHVVTEKSINGVSNQTEILVRKSGPGQKWSPLTMIPERVTSLACRSSDLVVLLNTGDWMFVWAADGATGSPLPAQGRIRAIADDGESLWAVGSVRGGLSAARSATTQATTSPSTENGDTYRSGTETSETPAATAASPQLVLFQQQAGAWVAVAEFPSPTDTFVAPSDDLSLSIVAGRPMVAFLLPSGAIRTLRLNANQIWEEAGLLGPLKENVADFRLFNTGAGIALWTNVGNGPGQIYPDINGTHPPVDLIWKGDHPPTSIPAITSAGGYLRIIGLNGDKLYEQRYDADGKPVGAESAIAVPGEIGEALENWVYYVICFALAFSVGATIYRRSSRSKSNAEIKIPAPAPLLPRLAAGVVDALPLLIVLMYVAFKTDESTYLTDRFQQISALIACGIGIGIYLLHTTASELITGRTVGKWIFGLKVVSIEGGPPDTLQIVLRNLLRVIDLLVFPLLIVLISPLRQRSADVAAGTMVTVVTPEPKKEDQA